MPDGNSLDLANFLQNAVKGDRNSDGWGANGGMLWIFLLILFGFGGFGAGGFGGLGRGGAGAVVNDAAITGAVETAIAKAHAAGVTDQLMLQAINGNKEAIDKMSIALNCDSNRISDALCTIKGGLDKVAGEVGMTSQQVVNAIQAGNASLTAQMQSCCCDIRNSITTSNYENQLQIVNQTNALSSQLQSQTNVLSAKIDAQTQLLNDRFCQLELREQARLINLQSNEISDLKGRLSTQEILAAIGTKTTSSAS